MLNNQRLGVEAKKLGLNLDKARRNILLYLVHMTPPVSIDSLVSLSSYPIVDVLNIMEDLKRKRFVYEKKGHGRGVYFLDDGKVADFVKENITKEEAEKVLRKLIDFYTQSSEEADDAILILAELFLKLKDIGKGLDYIKKAAKILYRSGQNDKAVIYYDYLLHYFEKNKPTITNVEIYLDSVVVKVLITMFAMPLDERWSLLLQAEKAAKQYKKWAHLLRIKLALGQVSQATGQFGKASKYIKDYWNIAGNKVDEAERKKAVLMITDYLYFKGKISEVIQRYEEKVGSLEEFGDSEGKLRAGAVVGYCYVLNGRVARGMGMIDAVRVKAGLLNLHRVVIFTDYLTALSLLEIRKVDEAEFYVNRVLSYRSEIPGPFVLQGVDTCKAIILTVRQDYEGAFEHLKKSIEFVPIVGASNRRAWSFEYLKILESKGFVHEGMNYDAEIKRLLDWDNVHMKGVAYRYRAERQQSENAMLSDLKASEKYLTQSGAEIELARTRIALGNHYLKKGESKIARSYFEKAWDLLAKIDTSLFPKDLLSIMPQEQKIEVMVDRVIGINESLGAVLDMSSFLEKVINAAMDFTMAMRGAFFVMEEGKPKIVASRNFDPSVLNTDRFRYIRQLITSVARENRETVMPGLKDGNGVSDESLREAGVTSLICIAASLNKHAYGYLYLDNRLGGGPFPDNQIPFVRMLCSQIAVGLSNIGVYKEMREMRDRFEEEAIFYKQEMGIAAPLEIIIGDSERIKTVKDRIRQVAPTDSSVLILGETGVGKELVAKAIHNLSQRKEGPFIPVNLAALPHELVASELFGHERGAFTGATERKKGRFELAEGGTIFLDEIGDLPPGVQVQLLRILQEGAFERLGSGAPIRSNFRVIAATNKDLRMQVEKGTFRQDLYYRLDVFPIYVPALREREDDISRLANYFVEKFGKKLSKRIRRIPIEEMKKLVEYPWPGNVRELEHCIEKAVILSDGNGIHFPDLGGASTWPISGEGLCSASLADIERDYIVRVLNTKRWKISGPNGAAVLLGLKPQTLHSRMKKLGINREN